LTLDSMTLDSIQSPADLKKLSREELPALAAELRQFVLDSVSKTGGHLSSNLGTVELSIALHYVFDTPNDRIVWDVGHQSYPHKILTGRRERMSTLRQLNGLSGFPRRTESEYDAFGTGHSSTSISAAMGMARAFQTKGEKQVAVAVIGDSAMTGGMAFEAMNNAGVYDDLPLVVILNDNDMSISPAVGALNRHLARLLSGNIYSATKKGIDSVLSIAPPLREFAKRLEDHAKGMVSPSTIFQEFGFNYFGPIDGHDLTALIPMLQNVRRLALEGRGPQFLHVVTRKGQGYELAEANPVLYHGPSKFNPEEGVKKPDIPPKKTFTQVFGEWLCDMAHADPLLVGITPAMSEGSGLVEFEKNFPKRYYDVGIAEQHAVTFAAGMACEGMKPVVAIYSTFLQRAYDQLIHDVAISKLAEKGRPGQFDLPKPMLHSGDLDFSFSGLKTAVLNQVKKFPEKNITDATEVAQFHADLARAFVESLVAVLVSKSERALKQTGCKDLVLAGGVGANLQLRAALNEKATKNGFEVHYPPLDLCTDNGVMIAFAGALRLLAPNNGSTTSGAFDIKPRWDLQSNNLA